MRTFFYSQFRKYQYTTFIPLFLIFTDVALILASLNGAYYYLSWLQRIPSETFTLLSIIAALCWVVSGLIVSSYIVDNLGRYRQIVIHTTTAGLLYAGLLYIFLTVMPSVSFSMTSLGALFVVTFPVVLLSKMVMLYGYRSYRQLNFHQKKVIIIGDTPRGRDLGRFFSVTHSIPQVLLGYFEDRPSHNLLFSDRYLGMLHQIKDYCLRNEVHEIYYALPNHRELLEDLTAFADAQFIYLGIVPDVDGLDGSRRVDTQLYDNGRIPVISSRKAPLRRLVNANVKRTFDIAFSSAALLVLSVLVFPFIALAIRLDSKGPILFKQLRPGRNNRPFWCYKFRTMRVNHADQLQATKNDCRITRVGAFLRRTSLDELPQFYNVLRGDMSVVGPRPNLTVHLEEYSKEIRDYPLRHLITPGITGYAQVNGYRGETKEVYQMQRRVEHDLWYIENWSLGFDLQIIGKTVWNIVKGEENAY